MVLKGREKAYSSRVRKTLKFHIAEIVFILWKILAPKWNKINSKWKIYWETFTSSWHSLLSKYTQKNLCFIKIVVINKIKSMTGNALERILALSIYLNGNVAVLTLLKELFVFEIGKAAIIEIWKKCLLRFSWVSIATHLLKVYCY